MEENLEICVVAMKATEDAWEVDVLGVPFGGPYKGKDKDGEYFSDRTNIHEDEFPTIPVVFAHGLDPETGRPMNPQYIGKAQYSHKDKRGHWYKAILKKTSEFAKKIWDAAQKGVAGASSGSILHLTRITSEGHIDEWPVTEMSLMDITGGVRPRNPYAVAMPVMKAMYEEAGIKTNLFDSGASGNEASQTNQSITNQKGDTMTAEEQKAADEKAAQAAKAAAESVSDDPMLNVIQRMKAEKDSAKKAKAEKAERESKLMEAMKAVMEDAEVDEGRKGGVLYGAAPAFNSKTGRGDNENKAFNHYLRTGDKGAYKALVIMNESDDESGGAVVPTDFFSKVIEFRDPSSVVRRMGAEVIPTSRLTINLPTEALRLTAPADTAESAGASATSRTINEVEPLDTVPVTVDNYTYLLRISEENLNDSAANLESFIANRVAKNFAIKENSALKTALYADVSNTVNAADDTTLAAADIFDTYYDLPEQYADGAVWLMKRATEGLVRQLAMSAGGFAFGATPQGTSDAAGQRTLLYNPVFNLADMDAVLAAKKVIYFGDPYYVKLVQNGTMTIRRLNERFADTGEVGFVCSQRFAIKVIGGSETWTYLLTLAS